MGSNLANKLIIPLTVLAGLGLAGCKTTPEGRAFSNFIAHTAASEFVRGEIKNLQGRRDYHQQKETTVKGYGPQEQQPRYETGDIYTSPDGFKWTRREDGFWIATSSTSGRSYLVNDSQVTGFVRESGRVVDTSNRQKQQKQDYISEIFNLDTGKKEIEILGGLGDDSYTDYLRNRAKSNNFPKSGYIITERFDGRIILQLRVIKTEDGKVEGFNLKTGEKGWWIEQ